MYEVNVVMIYTVVGAIIALCCILIVLEPILFAWDVFILRVNGYVKNANGKYIDKSTGKFISAEITNAVVDENRWKVLNLIAFLLVTVPYLIIQFN